MAADEPPSAALRRQGIASIGNALQPNNNSHNTMAYRYARQSHTGQRNADRPGKTPPGDPPYHTDNGSQQNRHPARKPWHQTTIPMIPQGDGKNTMARSVDSMEVEKRKPARRPASIIRGKGG
jgi:hypothetical protein